MDPLSRYLLSECQRQPHVCTSRYAECNEALNEMGYWLLDRPAGTELHEMPKTRIHEECDHISEFPQRVEGDATCEAFDVTVDVYADPEVTEVTWTTE